MTTKRFIYTFAAFLFFIGGKLCAQVGGENTYEFLNIPLSAKDAALGGGITSDASARDLFVYNNPALLDSSMIKEASFAYTGYLDDVRLGYASYSFAYKKFGVFSGGITYMNYGKFTEADVYGVKHGSFTASDYMMYVSWGYQLKQNWFVGASMKPIYSNYERYNSFGLAFDLAGRYVSKDKLFTASLVFRNIGGQIKKYNNVNESLPFEITAGISRRLKHAPFKLYLNLRHLETPELKIKEEKTKTTSLGGLSEKDDETKFQDYTDRVFRHVNLGVEFLPFKNFAVRVGYNHRRREELKLSKKAGAVGFSWGFGLKLSRFYINYGRASYHLSAASNVISISTNLSK